MAVIDVAKIRYELKALLSNGKFIEITSLVSQMQWSDPAEELSQRASFVIANFKSELGYISDIIKLCDRIYIYANKEKVFSGIVWDWEYLSSLKKEIRITAYDQMIYLTKSKMYSYFSSGQSTKSIIENICSEWEIPLKYEWESHTHGNIKNSSKIISECILEVLDEAQTKIESKYVIYFDNDTLYIRSIGYNKDVFFFNAKNVIKTKNKNTLNNLVTKVIVYGKEEKEGRPPIEGIETGKTEYGILQEIVSVSCNTSLDDAKKQAQNILNERGKPKETYTLNTPDIPFLRKGWKIKVEAGNLSGFFYVKGVTHDAINTTMEMEVFR